MKSIKKTLISLTLVLTMLTTLFSTNAFASGTSVKRLGGSTRYDTCISIANYTKTLYKEKYDMDKFDYILVTSGAGFADGLSASYLAYSLMAPILLVDTGYQDSVNKVNSFIASNLSSTGKIIILGGPNVVSDSFYNSLNSTYSGRVSRLYGDTRMDTNILVMIKTLNVLASDGYAPDTLLIASAENFPDALSGSAVSAPMMLVYGNSLTDNQKSFLASHHFSNFYILGGTSAVSSGVENQLKSLYPDYDYDYKRFSGKNRYDTSEQVAQYFFYDSDKEMYGSAYTSDLQPTSITVASAANFPDALCGGPLAQLLEAPLLLTGDGDTYTSTYTSKYLNNDYRIVVFGNSLTDAVINKLK